MSAQLDPRQPGGYFAVLVGNRRPVLAEIPHGARGTP